MPREHPPTSNPPLSLSEGPAPRELRTIFDRYHETVFAFFVHRGFDREDALDLTQETFLRVYKNMGSLRGIDSFPAWLRRIAANVWKNELRRLQAEKRAGTEVPIGRSDKSDGNAGRGALAEEQLAANGPDPLDSVLASEEVSLLRRSFAALPAQMRRCFQLRIDQDLKYSEIAAILQIKVNTVKSQVHQARQRLKAEIGRGARATTET